jgi:penicillin-binding protein 1A
MLRFIFSFIGAIFSALTLGLFFTALVVGAVLWMYGRDLPNTEQLAQYSPPTISRIYSGEGRLMDEFARERRLFVPAEDIPAIVKEAFISAEDKNFYNHKGYDPRGIAAAAFEAVRSRGQNVRGASTITQQVMKNFLLGGERSAERKIKEIILSARIEETLSKERILELYLNEIFLGQNSFGVAAAPQTYFNKPLGELEVHEAAYLAVLPKAPSTYHPVRNRERAVERRNFVLREMYENGYIDQATYEDARAQPLDTVQSGAFASFREELPPRDYFTDEIRRQLSQEFGEEEFFSGGLTIRATVDPVLQDEAAKALRKGLESYDRRLGVYHGPTARLTDEQMADWRSALAETAAPRDIEGWRPAVVLELDGADAVLGVEGVTLDAPQVLPGRDVGWARPRGEDGRLGSRAARVSNLLAVGDVILVAESDDANRWSLKQVPEVQGGFVAMDVHTGRVLAMQGGFSYQASVFNRATQAQRQPGSSFKPFVYAAALDTGYSPATIVIDAPIEIENGDGSIWRPKNASNQFYGPTTLRTGIERSRNLMTIRLAQELGMETVARYAEHFGVYDQMDAFLANALGAQETTLYRMVAAYAMFANGGERVEPTLVDRVQDRTGRTIYRHDQRECVDCTLASLDDSLAPSIVSNRQRVIDPITAYQLTSMMRGVVDRGTAASTVNLPVPTAGKTGTTNDAKDAWFIGFTSNIVAGCYIGYDTPRTMPGASGGGMCGPVFNDFMKTAVALYGGGRFRVPPGGVFVNIDRFSGQRLPDGAVGEYVQAEYFREGEEPLDGYSVILDGGFAMGSNLPLFTRGNEEAANEDQQVITSTGERAVVPGRATFGSLTAGGLY